MREALVLDPGGNAAVVLSHASFSGWDFHVVDTVEAAQHALDAVQFVVGIAVSCPGRGFQPAQLEPLLLRPGVEWIALVPPEATRDPGLRPLLTRAFHDFHTVPIDPARLAVTLGHAYGKATLRADEAREREPGGRYGMVGACPAMLDLYRRLERICAVEAPVLIQGESGTGKELVASAIHRHSPRAAGPFVAVNCGAIPDSLIQSELFGYEKGAFAGAYQRKVGSVEAAHGGVLLLDEIGDLAADMQANLLRFLQEKTVVRLGSPQPVRVDVRVVAATNVDLRHAVAAGSFREDLFYRLNVLQLRIPPLRERGADILLLAEAFFRRHARDELTVAQGFAREALRAMEVYDWPGNVRELANRVRRALLMSENRLISAADLGLDAPTLAHKRPTLDDARAQAERAAIEACLRQHHQNVSQTARQLGVSRVTLYRMMSRLNIAPQRPGSGLGVSAGANPGSGQNAAPLPGRGVWPPGLLGRPGGSVRPGQDPRAKPA